MNLKWQLSYARGYMELGLFAEAAAELERVADRDRERIEYLAVYALLHQELKNWSELERVGEHLCRLQPEEASWWIMHAYGARRATSIEKAREILLEAEKRHPNEATIHFNLGCYACQRGDLLAAKCYVDRAVELDAQFAEAAKTDPDLKALREHDAGLK